MAEGIAVSSGDGRAATAADIDNMLFILKREQRLEELRDAVGLQISQLERDHAAKQSEIRQSWAAIARVRDERTLQADFILTDLEQFSYALPGHSRLKYERVIEDSAIESHLKIQSLFEVLDVGFANGDVDSATLARFNDTRTRTEELLVALSSAVEAANKASHDLQAERGPDSGADRTAQRQARRTQAEYCRVAENAARRVDRAGPAVRAQPEFAVLARYPDAIGQFPDDLPDLDRDHRRRRVGNGRRLLAPLLFFDRSRRPDTFALVCERGRGDRRSHRNLPVFRRGHARLYPRRRTCKRG